MKASTRFSINAKTCTLKYNTQDNGDIILNGTNYLIPIYQRPYSWAEEQLRKFISDLFSSYWGTEGHIVEEPMFIGTMQLSTKEHNSNQNVIDGQQRLTTFLILLKVLKHKFPNNLELQNLCLNWLQTKVNNGNEQTYLEELLNSDLSFNDETLNTYLKNAFIITEIIEEEIKDESGRFNSFDVERFVKYLLSEVYFVVIETCAGLSKTLQIFNSINTAGLDLNGSDVFKIRMFEYLMKKKECDERVFDDISALYQKIDNYNNSLGYNETDMRGILNIYQYILIAKYYLPVVLYTYATDTFFERLFDSILNVNQWEHFRNNVTQMELSIDEIDRIIEVRYEWENSEYPTAEDACVHYLFRWYSRYGRYWNLIFIFLFRFKSEERYFEKMLLFKRQLNKLYLVYSIRFHRTINEIHTFTYSLLKDILHKSHAEIMEKINHKIKHIEQQKHWYIEDVLYKDIIYNWKVKNIVCRLSAMIEEDYKTTDKAEIEKIKKYLFEAQIDIEHIQSYHDSDGNKRQDIWDFWQENINSIGNLMILEQNINRSISNSDYEIKKVRYPESNFEIVKKQVKDFPEWNLSKCIDRKEKETAKILNYIFS